MIPAPVKRAICIPWKENEASWEELRYCLRSLARYWLDRDCSVYILSAYPPKWLDQANGRVIWINARSYQDALALGVQLAEEILWLNDDICLMRDMGWDDFTTHYSMFEMSRQQREEWFYNSNSWKRGMARAMDDLAHQGKGNLNCETHVPYRWERDKMLEIFRTYGCYYKMPANTFYVNHFGLPAVPLGDYRKSNPLGDAPILNYVDHQISDVFKDAMAMRFPDPAPCEIAA